MSVSKKEEFEEIERNLSIKYKGLKTENIER